MEDRYTHAFGVPCVYCGVGVAREPAANGWPPEQLVHLYLCRELSTYRIAELTGLDRQRVTRALRRAGVPCIPAGSVVSGRSGTGPIRPATVTGVPERAVRDRLRRYGIRARHRGGWNREDRQTVPAETLWALYEQLGMTAAEVGQVIGVSRTTVLRSAHDLGVAVRVGGAVPLSGPDEIELVRALYADDRIASVLIAHDVPQVPPGRPIWARFPAPVPLSASLVKDLYWYCGAGLNHIELLTGQPAMTVSGFMRREGIPVRHPGGRTPFLRRWRTGQADPAERPPRRPAGSQ